MAIYGRQPYGSDTSAVLHDGGGSITKNPYSGEQNGSRKINPATKDYDIDTTTGRIKGMTNAQQLVFLAVSTTRGSSAMRSLGQELKKIERITNNFIRRVDSTLRTAVQHIVDFGIIAVLGTQVQIVRPGVAIARLRWRDLETGKEEVTAIGEAPEEPVSAADILVRPTLLGMSQDIADTAGGESIRIAGYNLSSASSVTVGGTSASITGNTSTSVTFTMPAKAAGTYDVIVTNSLGTSNALSIDAWTPSAMSLTGQWRASYTGSPWVAVSGGNLTEATNPPATGTAVNSLTPADFDGTNDKIGSASTAATFYGSASYSMAALVYVDTFTTTDPGAAAPYNCPVLVGDEDSANAGPCGGVVGSGSIGVFRFGHLDATLGWVSVSTAVSTGAWTLVRAKYDGSQMYVATNGGDWQTAVVTTFRTSSFSGTLKIGPSNGSSHFFDGKVLHALTSDTVLTDTEFDKLRRYFNVRYALHL